jgi:negative regulator of replication initiation
MRFFKVDVDEQVFQFVKGHAEPLVDTFNSTLRRLLPLLSTAKIAIQPVSATEDGKQINSKELPMIPRHTPAALSQILEVVNLVRGGAYTRAMATHRIAKHRNITPQTVLDAYCRQLNLRADQFDRLLAQADLEELRKILKSKFPRNSEIIDEILG